MSNAQLSDTTGASTGPDSASSFRRQAHRQMPGCVHFERIDDADVRDPDDAPLRDPASRGLLGERSAASQ